MTETKIWSSDMRHTRQRGQGNIMRNCEILYCATPGFSRVMDSTRTIPPHLSENEKSITLITKLTKKKILLTES